MSETYPVAYPFQALIGFRKTAFEDGFCRLELDLGAQHSNRGGLAHGGVHATLLDAAMGAAGCWDGRPDDFQPAVTLSLTVNFIAPAQGARLIAEGRRVGGGARIYFSEGVITDETGITVARGSGAFKLLTRR